MRVAYTFITMLARVMNIAILARVLLSWVNVDPNNRLIRILYEITEPILGPIRRVMPSLGGLDLSPMIALVLISLAERVLLAVVAGIG